MSPLILQQVSTLTLELILAIAASVRFKKVISLYTPFLIVCILGFVSDAVSVALAYTRRHNLECGNIYVLLEYCFFLWQFYLWKNCSKPFIIALLCVGISVWLGEVLWVNKSLSLIAGIYRTVYSFIIVFLAIRQINKVLINERGMLTRNSVFLICIGFVFYYAIKCVVELMYLVNISFSIHIWYLLVISNLLAVILYTIAVLWIPTRKKFTLQY